MNVTAIILAGGKSSRMGADKGLVHVRGKAMIQHLIALFQKMDIPSIIVSNNDAYEAFGIPVVRDMIDEKGPLVGIISGLSFSKTEQNIIVSCDTPFLTSDVISTLIVNHNNHEITVSRVGKRLNPLIGIYNKACISQILTQIDKGDHKVELLLQRVRSNVIEFSDGDDRFVNLNSPEDLPSNQNNVIVRFFGQLTEVIGSSNAQITLPEMNSVIILKDLLVSSYPELKGFEFRTAVDEELKDYLEAGCNPKEIAVFPPFAGG